MAEQTRIIMDELKILDYFHDLKKDESPILIWTKVNGGPERKLFYCHVQHCNLVDHEIGALNHDPSQSLSKYCSEDAEIYVYSEKDSMLLKSSIKRFHGDLLVIHFPKKINIVADEMKLNIHRTIEALDPTLAKIKQQSEEHARKDEHGIEIELPDEQSTFKNLRASPRGKAEEGQIAKVQVTRENNVLGTTSHTVFDISRGGISLLSLKPNELLKSDKIIILEINGDPPPFPLEGEVVSIKRIDLKETKYRVGIKFNE